MPWLWRVIQTDFVFLGMDALGAIFSLLALGMYMCVYIYASPRFIGSSCYPVLLSVYSTKNPCYSRTTNIRYPRRSSLYPCVSNPTPSLLTLSLCDQISLPWQFSFQFLFNQPPHPLPSPRPYTREAQNAKTGKETYTYAKQKCTTNDIASS